MVEHQPPDMPTAIAKALSDQVRAAIVDIVKGVRDDGLTPGDPAPRQAVDTLVGVFSGNFCGCGACQAMNLMWVVMVVLAEVGLVEKEVPA